MKEIVLNNRTQCIFSKFKTKVAVKHVLVPKLTFCN